MPMLLAVLEVVFTVLRIVQLLILGRVVAGWLNADENNFIVRVLRETTEPLFALVRPLARKIPGPLDWSPVILLVGLGFVRHLLGLLV
jgi:YggT family protein